MGIIGTCYNIVVESNFWNRLVHSLITCQIKIQRSFKKSNPLDSRVFVRPIKESFGLNCFYVVLTRGSSSSEKTKQKYYGRWTMAIHRWSFWFEVWHFYSALCFLLVFTISHKTRWLPNLIYNSFESFPTEMLKAIFLNSNYWKTFLINVLLRSNLFEEVAKKIDFFPP